MNQARVRRQKAYQAAILDWLAQSQSKDLHYCHYNRRRWLFKSMSRTGEQTKCSGHGPISVQVLSLETTRLLDKVMLLYPTTPRRSIHHGVIEDDSRLKL
jgi:hypothetical protein